MRLESVDGGFLDLSIVGYQFGPSGEPRDWDANWLVVAGSVALADGTSWSFKDPCLTSWEARELLDWLRAVQRGHVQPSGWDSDEERLLVFTEPNIAFSLAAKAASSVTIRAHLSLESAPPGGGELFDYYVPLELPSGTLADAIDAWATALMAFPVR